MTPREYATSVVRTLQSAGFTAYWAGGCVRDELLGLEPDDYDVATDAPPEKVQQLFQRTLAIGASFGVIEVLGPKVRGEWLKVQVATFRTDGLYIDGRRPETVIFSTPEQDAQRRDFTINGLFHDPVADVLHDFVGGQNDLKNKLLRAIGDPSARFEEDKLRILRAVRMATRFKLNVDPATLTAARLLAPRITLVSPERIAEELRKLLSHPRRAFGLKLLNEFELVVPILPEAEGEFDLAIRTAESLPTDASFPLTLASVLRSASPTVAQNVGQRLRLSNDETSRVAWLVAMQCSLTAAESLPKSRLYPILIHPGIGELLALHRAIAATDGLSVAGIELCETILQSTPRATLDPPPLITGDDLVDAGWRPGPEFKLVLEAVRCRQLDGEILTRDDAMELARKKLS